MNATLPMVDVNKNVSMSLETTVVVVSMDTNSRPMVSTAQVYILLADKAYYGLRYN